MDYTKAIQIAQNIHWVGMYLENDPFQCHPYFIHNGDESILIDPGSMIEFDAVMEKTSQITDLKNIKYIILHHQDPDLCASIPEIEKVIDRDDLKIITHSRMTVLIKHYMITSSYYEIDKNDFKLETNNGFSLKFLTTPYCHSPGAFVTYDPKSKVLFSSDIFGGLEESWEFYAKDDYFSKVKAFHSTYMPSRDIFNHALRKIEQLDINLIAPQHGSIIERRYVYGLIEDMKNLECGLYIDKKYNDELTGTIEKLKAKERELKEYKNHLEEKVKEKTYFLEEANAALQLEQEKLNMFNEYLGELNSVDVGFLANTAIKQILNIAQAQIGVFYINENDKRLKVLAKHSVDPKLLKSGFFNNSSGGIVAQAYKSGEWIYVDGLNEEVAPEIDLGFYRSKLKHIVAIPLKFQEKKIGVVLIGSVSNARFDEDYLKGYINTLVQSLNNAITYVETQKQSIELRDINMQLEEANRLKSEFLANVSHELRTPLNSIIGFSNILQKNKKGNLLPKQLDQLEKINRNGMNLLDLINNILDLSKIESGKMEVEFREIDIVSAVHDTLELLMPQAANGGKKISFTNSLGSGAYKYTTDEQKFKQVIVNIVSNALKFVENGIGKVDVEVFEENEMLKIAVKDNGIGIPEEKFEKIFEAFRQSDGSTTRRFGGTGLGLAISKNMLELLGGYIDLESIVGEGSTFTICLPLNKKQSSILSPDFLNDFKEKLYTLEDITSVLVIDDAKDVRDLIAEYLSDQNYIVYAADNGYDGVEMAKKLKPSLITLDIMMPGMDGWEVLKRLKASNETCDIPVVTITNASNRSKSIYLGAIDSISKPLSKDDLLSFISKYFDTGKAGSALIVDDEEDIRELIQEYIEDDIKNIQSASDGKEALEVIERGFVPDIIYLDLMMPNLSGFEFLKIVETNPKFKNTHIAVVTAKDLTNEDMEILKPSCVSIIKKGGNIEEIIKELAQDAKNGRSK
ncbi:oxygen-binding di-iron domain-containing protein [Hydrogenimonas sp.]